MSEDRVPYKAFQQRVVDENTELEEKLTKLTAFLEGQVFATLDKEDQVLLQAQWTAMHEYWRVLGLRIRRFS
jgi:hypothetical protein